MLSIISKGKREKKEILEKFKSELAYYTNCYFSSSHSRTRPPFCEDLVLFMLVVNWENFETFLKMQWCSFMGRREIKYFFLENTWNLWMMRVENEANRVIQYFLRNIFVIVSKLFYFHKAFKVAWKIAPISPLIYSHPQG